MSGHLHSFVVWSTVDRIDRSRLFHSIAELVRSTSARLDVADAAMLHQTYLLVTGRAS